MHLSSQNPDVPTHQIGRKKSSPPQYERLPYSSAISATTTVTVITPATTPNKVFCYHQDHCIYSTPSQSPLYTTTTTENVPSPPQNIPSFSPSLTFHSSSPPPLPPPPTSVWRGKGGGREGGGGGGPE